MKEQIVLIKKLIYIFVPVIIIIVIFEVYARGFENSFTYKRNLFEKRMDSIELLILGSSHGYMSINPEIICRNSFNMANYSQDLYCDYMLQNKYKAELKNLKCIILTLSYFSLWYDMNDAPEKWRKFFYKRYFEIEPRNPLVFSDIIDIKSYSFAFFYKLDNTLFRILNPESYKQETRMNSYGWCLDLTDISVDSINDNMGKVEERVKFTNSMINESKLEENMRYIDGFVKFANDRNIAIVFITAPVSSLYSLRINKNYYNELIKRINEYVNKNQKVIYLNYFYDNRFYMKDFYDYDHLNNFGAIKFSTILRDTMINLKVFNIN